MTKPVDVPSGAGLTRISFASSIEGNGRSVFADDPGRAVLEEVPVVGRALGSLVVEIGLLAGAAVLPVPPSMLVRLGDSEIRNWAETPPGFALLAPVVAGAVAGGPGSGDGVDGEEDWDDWAAAEPLERRYEVALGVLAVPEALVGGVAAAD
jgi:hypothetical protein